MKIEIVNYCKTIKKQTILENINLSMESGKVYGLKGKNGSGKTMLMRAISGLIKPTSGTISVDGEIIRKDITFPRSVGMLLENPAFLSNYTGFKNLKVLASIQNRIGDDEIRKTLE
ncbi:MAG: ATP-binding cassette domain-containing protein, partial [Lachnospira sp.]